MDLAQYEQLNPRCEVSWQGRTVVYATPNQLARARAESLFTKEPVTIEWMSQLGPDDVLADVGANVGMYTIWAAGIAGARVYAFEPESQNYALLNRNIALNGLGGRVKAFCLALSDRAGYSELHLSEFVAGGSCHSLGEPVNFKLEPARPAFSQGCVAARLDDLVTAGALPQPTHLKIDVDGFEHRVVAGAAGTLRDRALRSMIVEVNPALEPHRRLLEELRGMGFRWDAAQVSAAERKEGAFKGVAEYVFTR
ncbi:MAG TPA: FkbM family methyltransferase [Burkholderiales bacterium]|nr:FkbM family methyltransferase [Burkholderiales bacterium]